MNDFEYLGRAYKILSAQVVKEILNGKGINELAHQGSELAESD